MTLPVLPPIAMANINQPELRYRWDDMRASEDFVRPAPDGLLTRLAPVSLRAKLAVAIGMYEWIVYRYQGLTSDSLPFDLAEGAWCANVNRTYMEYLELARRDWLGPIRGPIWCAVTWLLPALYFSDDEPEEWESGALYLSRLALHVVPDPDAFERWLDVTVARVASLYTVAPPDKFEDLFGEREEDRRGPLVAREVLDPAFPYREEDSERLVADFLATVDYRTNRLLRSPGEMVQCDFRGVPYRVDRNPR